MPTTVPADIPTWFIVLEYLKVLFSPACLVAVGGLVLLTIYLWTFIIHPNGIRCDAKWSQAIDLLAGCDAAIAKHVEQGEYPEHLMREFIINAAKTSAAIKKAKDAGSANIVKDAFTELVRHLAKSEVELHVAAHTKGEDDQQKGK